MKDVLLNVKDKIVLNCFIVEFEFGSYMISRHCFKSITSADIDHKLFDKNLKMEDCKLDDNLGKVKRINENNNKNMFVMELQTDLSKKSVATMFCAVLNALQQEMQKYEKRLSSVTTWSSDPLIFQAKLMVCL